MPTTLESTRSKILIVDDSAFEQRMLVDLLSELPYKVSVAFNGLQGYQLALAQRPDLILLDVRMPNMDGYTACRLLKANPVTQDIPVIFLSGADADDDRILGLSIGGVDYVSKPFSPGELAARIQVHLNLAKRQHAAPPAEGDETPEPEAENDPDAVLVNAVKRLIADNLAALPGLAEIARSVGTYREKLSQVFREQTGMTVFGFIREERIRRGEELLKDTDIDVQDIALLIGFNNAGNFATAFRERMGVTPTAYRQAIHKK
ncbi:MULTISPECIES: response regulator [unclassified Duganella]|jgi:DNA-binding response OmpR family regulator|uniref:response regulator transcription factor n=1 Tax=unclassified Duganella TaxID=2636909 RepID=UPI00088BF1CF|nr:MULTISPECIES: response regulator [unclassified Duganella]SDH18179.1 Helix-turn-helix domain-containing protein [Duganella sp. OV458]SDK32601.1 two component transcriptional regulator, AraC family [Duganella sp. OV510]